MRLIKFFSVMGIALMCSYQGLADDVMAHSDKVKNNGKEDQVIDPLMQLERTAAEHGDTPSMARVADDCLRRKDYICAYKWASLALIGGYFWATEQYHIVLDIRDKAYDGLSPEEVKQSVQQVRDFTSSRVKNGKQADDPTTTLPLDQLQELAEKGKVQACGNLAKRCYMDGNYPCAYHWATLAGMGSWWWRRGENILILRDVSRQSMTSAEIKDANQKIDRQFQRFKSMALGSTK